MIEADGSIAVHNKDSKAKTYRPKIIIVFSYADEPLAKKLASSIGAGTVYKKKCWLCSMTNSKIRRCNKNY